MNPHKPRIKKTHGMPNPNAYVQMLLGEYAQWAFDETRAPNFRGRWREEIFGTNDEKYEVDLELGTGNGYHFAHHVQQFPMRGLVGVELKYKPLIQSIRRAIKAGKKNGRMIRYNAFRMTEIFAEGEVSNIFIHFPDPWPKKKYWKNRFVCQETLTELHRLQKQGSYIEFKTDSRDYFEWALEEISKTPYQTVFKTFDLHQSERAEENFVTQFERIFLQQGQPIHMAQLKKV